MKCIFLGIIFAFTICKIFSKSNINNTVPFRIADNGANLLIGIPSSHFPGSSMINFVLYGHSDMGFSYLDFLHSYGINSSYLEPGDLVIGSDGELGGIADFNNNIVIPVPFSTVQDFPQNQINHFFPHGYNILKNPNDIDTFKYRGMEKGQIGDTDICLQCDVVLMCHNVSNTFDIYNIVYLAINDNCHVGYAQLYGYISSFDSKAKNGSMMIFFYETFNKINVVRHFLYTDEDQDNTVMFTLDAINNMQYNGSIYVLFGYLKDFYKFSGIMRPEKNLESS